MKWRRHHSWQHHRIAVLSLLVGWTALAGEPKARPGQAGTPATFATNAPTVGMEGRVEIALPGTLLEARPVDEKSLVIVRVAEALPHGTLTRYDLRYIGLVPGKYDLRDYLRRRDGSPLDQLPPLPVEIAGLLPAAHTGELIEQPRGLLGFFGGYRNALLAFAVIWVLAVIPLWLFGRRKKAAVVAPVELHQPTLAERLRPLVEQAATGQLSADGKAQLERLLLSHWRERLHLGDLDQAEAIAQLRQDPDAGALLVALENWLHRPPGVASVDVTSLLAPYRRPAANTAPDPTASRP
jgi:hypothetical protein